MTYAGGQVDVNGIESYYDPIYLFQARPAIGYNSITYQPARGRLGRSQQLRGIALL